MFRPTTGAARTRRASPLMSPGGANRWSVPATWGGTVPTGGQITIPSGQTYYLDCETAKLGELVIAGALIVDPAASIVGITAANISITATGTLQIGSESIPYGGRATITLTGLESDAPRASRFVARQTGYALGVANVSTASGVLASDQSQATSYLDNRSTTLGKLKRMSTLAGAVTEVITVTFSSPTDFSVSGSSTLGMGSGTVGTLFTSSPPRIQFLVVTGSTAYTSGNTFTIDVLQLGSSNTGLPRSLQVQPGGKLILQGRPPAITRTKINNTSHLVAGDATLALADSVGWGSQDRIVVGATDFYGTTSGTPEQLWSAGAYGTTAPIRGTAARGKWGRLQYATDAGMSYTAGTLTDTMGVGANFANIPTVLDERAPVVNLSRNIIIQGIDDADWATNKFGAHCMFMGLSSEIKVNGVEFRRVGQAGIIGRYPFHWHVLSYNMPQSMILPSDGTFIGDANPANHYIKNCAIHQSSQRMVVIHGTCGVLVDNNVGYDITGHAIFLEEGSEERNTITNNTVIKVTRPTFANAVVLSERSGDANETTGIWYSNPNNTLTGNWVSNADGPGIWNNFQPKPIGLTADVVLAPYNQAILAHSDNTCHSNRVHGMRTESPAIDNAGSTRAHRYAPSAEFLIENQKIWKNQGGGYQNRINLGRYRGWVQADNEGLDFFGAAASENPTSLGHQILQVGYSLNNATDRTNLVTNPGPRSGFASYHELLNFQDGVLINYPYKAPVAIDFDRPFYGGGMVRTDDLYLNTLYRFNKFTKLKKINSHMGARSLPPHADVSGSTVGPRNYTLAGAFKDEAGLWTTAGWYLVHNLPYFTFNLTTPTSDGGNQIATPDIFYGVTVAEINSNTNYREAATVDRLNGSNVSQGTYAIPAVGASILGTARNFACVKNGRYALTLPGTTITSKVGLEIENAAIGTDNFLISVPWPSGLTVANCFVSSRNYATPSAGDLSSGFARTLTSAANLAAVEAGSGNLYWKDTGNNVVWIKYVGGLNDAGAWGSNSPTTQEFYKPIKLVISTS